MPLLGGSGRAAWESVDRSKVGEHGLARDVTRGGGLHTPSKECQKVAAKRGKNKGKASPRLGERKSSEGGRKRSSAKEAKPKPEEDPSRNNSRPEGERQCV